MRLSSGVRLGPYEVIALLGAGGMAEVYRARDTRLGREVAVKVVSEALGADAAFVERFEREARLVGSVTHPNVVALYDVGVHDGKPYFVTELLQGETLRTRLAKGLVPLQTALDWAAQMADGLAAAHEHGIVHRDLKPENVLVSRERHVKLLDFGIAKVIAAAHEPTEPPHSHDLLQETVASASGKTATGLIIGTPGYMSPEQLRGQPVDARTDVFSFGAVLHEVLGGRRAFPGDSAVESGYATLQHEALPLPPSVPAEVAQVVRRCLEKDPARRFQSARDLSSALEALRSVSSPTTPAAPPRSSRRWWLVASAVALVAIGGALWLSVRNGRRSSPSGPSVAVTASPAASIAVLPFVNLSPEKEQEYFADGITEELLDALARVKGLKVAGRTSSFHFKGKNENLRSIGETLGVANIVEGSVRKQGNRVRITAQLVQVADGFHLWSKTFEGDLKDVFDLQEKIARAITDELKGVLHTEPRGRLVPVATNNAEAYSLYLQATAIFNRRDIDRFPEAIAQIERALQLDPSYARAWSRLGTLWVLIGISRPGEYAATLSAAEKAARRAIGLDPSLAEPHAVLANAAWSRRDRLEARASLRRALELDPDDVTANFWFAVVLYCEGYIRQAVEVLDKLLRLDPLYPNALAWRGLAAMTLGDIDLAERLCQQARDAGLLSASYQLAELAAERRQPQKAVALMIEGLSPFSVGLPAATVEAIARGAYGDAREREHAIVLIERYLSSRPSVWSATLPAGLLLLGRPGQALSLLAGRFTPGDTLPFVMLWSRRTREARQLPEFSEFAERVGLVDVWEQEGPPDLCRRVEPKKYVCQ